MRNKVLIPVVAVAMLMAFFTMCKEEDPIETKGNISGTVTEDGSNKAISAAVVTVSGVSQTYKTGDDGKRKSRKNHQRRFFIRKRSA